MELNNNIHFRVSDTDKEKIDLVLNDINQHANNKKGYRFLLMSFVNEYLENNNTGLICKRNQLLKELEQEKEKQNIATNNISQLEIRINNLNHEINNKTIFDIANYKYHDNINHAFNRIKEYCLNPINNINVFEDIPQEIFLNLETTFKIKEKGLLKNIAHNHFNEWQKDKKINDATPEPTKQDIINNISDKILNRFNNNIQPIKKLNEYLNQTQTRQIITGYLKNIDQDINENDIINYMLNLPDVKQLKNKPITRNYKQRNF